MGVGGGEGEGPLGEAQMRAQLVLSELLWAAFLLFIGGALGTWHGRLGGCTIYVVDEETATFE